MTTTVDTDNRGMNDTAEEPAEDGQRKPRPRFFARRDPLAWGIGALAGLLGVVFVVIDLAYNQGNLIAPIDDAYIHLQYGKQLGSGHFFQYNTGDPISTGASSILYSFVLGAGYAIGFTGTLFLPFAVAFGVGCFAITAGLIYKLGTTLIDRAVGIWSGLLVAVSGPLLWGATSGMEVGLAAMLAAATVLMFTRERDRGRFVRTPILAALLALVRPEGLFFAVMLSGAMLWTALKSDERSGSPRHRWPWLGWTLLPLLAGIAQYAFYKLATGTFSANGVQAKSFLNDRPVFYFGDFVDRTIANVRGVIDDFNALGNQDYAFPGAVLFFLIGLAYLLASRPKWRSLTIAVGLGFAVVVVSASTLNTALIHEMRYFQPFMPLFILLTVCGIYGVTRVPSRERPRRLALHTLLVVVMLFSLVALPTWGVRLGREAATIRDTDVSLAAWVRGNLPPDAIVGVKDVGAIAYFGERKVVDLVGLATNGLAEPSNNGAGSLYEALRKSPPAQRPTHFAVYEPPPGVPMQPFVDAGLFGPGPLMNLPVRAPVDLQGRRIVPFGELQVYEADWTLAGSGDLPPAAVNGEVRDYLNTGDLDSERIHDYEPHMQQVGLQPNTVLRRHENTIDSGRVILGGEELTVRNLTPGEPVTMTSRMLLTGPEHQLRVVVDGEPVGVWDLGSEPNRWSTETFRIPGEAVTAEEITLELQPVRELLSPYPEYTSFGYWFAQ